MRVEENQGRTAATADQVLGEIRDYCRATQTAESTFGRLVVNDGKLVSRLRDGAKITTGTLDKVRAYLSEHSNGLPLASGKLPAPARAVNGSAVAADVVPAGFRFFDNRQKYLLFVSTCSEKTEVASRISLELGNLQPAPPALRPRVPVRPRAVTAPRARTSRPGPAARAARPAPPPPVRSAPPPERRAASAGAGCCAPRWPR